jgi:hypothetical protein
MAKKKTYTSKIKSSSVNEPQLSYPANRIVFFKSFEEEELFVAKERMNIPYTKRMMNIEQLRKHVFNKLLLPDGSWSPITHAFKIMPPYTNDISQ